MPDVQEVFRMATQKVRPDPGALERQSRTQRRRAITQRAGGYVLLAVLVIAAVVIGALALRPQEERPAGEGEQDAPAVPSSSQPFFLDLETREDDPATYAGETRPLPENLAGGQSYAASPDGTRVIYGTGSGSGCQEGEVVTVANVDGTDAQTLESPEGLNICGFDWSLDGTKILYQERDGADSTDVGNLFVHDLSTGQRTQVTDLELTSAWWWFLSPSFSPSGRDVIFHMPRSSSQTTTWDVWSVPVTGGEPTLVLRNASFPMLRGEGPEGERIQFLLPMSRDFAGQSLMTGRPIPGSDIRQTLVEANFSIWWPTLSPDGDRIAYQDGGSIYVLDLFTGASSKVAEGDTAQWLDFDTLIVTP
jgi:Tol biopolymer transport system component